MGAERSEDIVKVKIPSKREVRTVRILICCGIFSALVFFGWFIQNVESGYTPLFWLLTIALLFKLAKMFNEWYYYWSPSVPKAPAQTRNWTVDILTTSCPGEPRDMIIRTLRAMCDVRYPHTNYLCDEGDDPELKKVCEELGVIHVTRKEKTDAKAGNINNALRGASGEICLVLDPDHVPRPEFLDRVLPYFEDEKIGYVQCVQSYGNQEESFIARGAAEQTYHFYGPMMMTMNSFGTVQAIGANCTFRRKALDSIGGHAAGLAEDMHTAMQLQAKGWKAVYVPEVLARGLVPATLSAYYKQQLKWSRGVFELLFRVYPGLFKNFTWRQRIHYASVPWYFLFGLINLIDIIIPLVALAVARVPWEVDLVNFAWYFFPMCVMSLLVRFYVQRWLLEKHERGLHITGGMLRAATWWIFLVGFVYAIFNIKVPYIPTPKEDEHSNCFRLNIPNICVILISITFIWYGLSIDWSPYSMAMAFYSFVVIGMLGYTTLMSQQKFLDDAKRILSGIPGLVRVSSSITTFLTRTQQNIYSFMQNGATVLILAGSLAFLSYSTIENEPGNETQLISKEGGGFFIGIESSGKGGIPFIPLTGINLVSVEQEWADTASAFSPMTLGKIDKKNAVPFVSWKVKETIYPSILRHEQDGFLKNCADRIRSFGKPIFISLPLDTSLNGKSGNEFKKAWQYLNTYFTGLGISNITWVWSPRHPACEAFYPGEKFVDWIGVPCVNYGDASNDNDWYSFSDLYKPFRDHLGKFQKPIMITGMGSPAGVEQTKWFEAAFSAIREKYREIKAVILHTGIETYHFANDPKTYKLDFSLHKESYASLNTQFGSSPFSISPLIGNEHYLDLPSKTYNSPFVKGKHGNYELWVNNEPCYFRGVAYNTAHDWRDGFMPLTRRQVEKDLEMIKAMGANTIRRYDHGIYDRNILNIAAEYDLNVLYGFWFDPATDFYKDSLAVKKYIRDVEAKVIEFKDKQAIVAWSLGNETWGLLKHHYSKPYLVNVRRQYVKMIEYLARRIHELDPARPVFSCIEHEEYQLAGELVAFRDGAPSLDAMGINSYYKEQISQLDHITWQFDSLRPYLISEFGPRGYWDPHYNRSKDGLLTEDSEKEKAAWYNQQWNNYVLAHKGSNIGGFAYCWHDRMEGSCTWFGLTDFKGRPKPSYFALKELWTGTKTAGRDTEFAIQSPGTYKAGNEYVYTAVGNSEGKLKYEWYLHKNNFLERVKNIEYLDEGRSVKVTIPRELSMYRLYLYVSDEEGKVSTASVPIPVTKEKL